jgi:prepilin-type N-terminal cleavage/methylation domain-containing protein
MRCNQRQSGFTLAELLLVLACLGVIAAFTIPKVLQSQQDTKFKSIAKEAAGTVSSAYMQLKLRGLHDTNTKLGSITPYMNYVTLDTSAATIDLYQGASNRACNIGYHCLKLHNGAMMMYSDASFGDVTDNRGLYFYIDPDGVDSGTTTGPGKSVLFFIYYDGKLRSRNNVIANTTDSTGNTYNPGTTYDPPWFDWN